MPTDPLEAHPGAIDDQRPKLRAVDVQPIVHHEQPSLYLRDPLALSESSVAVPQVLGPVLGLLDGTRDLAAVRRVYNFRYGVQLGLEPIERLVAALDDVCLLDNARAADAAAAALDAFRDADHRPPYLAGASYPADPDALEAHLDGYLVMVEATTDGRDGYRGLVGPHIDYMRGGPAYARVWGRAAAAARAAEVVVILGTDHFGAPGRITLTRQHYATPYGVLPTPAAVVDRLAAAIGAEDAFEGELNHRTEHSVELSAVWLHHVRGGEPVETVPVLVGSFGHFIADEANGPAGDPTVEGFLAALADATAGRRVLVVASVDLAHVGPAFGGAPLDAADRAVLEAADARLIEPMRAGDADGFFAEIRLTGDATNVCGTAPIYLALRALGDTAGETVCYDQCPADEGNTSTVSVCGVLFD